MSAYTYMVAHTQGHGGSGDLVLLIADAEQRDQLSLLAQMICADNGRVRDADEAEARWIAEHTPRCLYGASDATDDLTVERRLRRCYLLTSNDLCPGVTAHDALGRLYRGRDEVVEVVTVTDDTRDEIVQAVADTLVHNAGTPAGLPGAVDVARRLLAEGHAWHLPSAYDHELNLTTERRARVDEDTLTAAARLADERLRDRVA